MRWLEVEPQHTDPAYVLWTTARLVDTDKLPTPQVTIRIDVRDLPQQQYWLLLHHPQAEVGSRYPARPRTWSCTPTPTPSRAGIYAN